MKTSKIRELVKIVELHNIEEIELSSWGSKIKISKTGFQGKYVPAHVEAKQAAPQPEVQTVSALPESAKSGAPTEQGNVNTLQVKTPIVGTYYSAPAPDAAPFVKVGDTISVGQTLCIVEAMKIMNEIEAEFSGKIKEILIENAQPVEYDQPLFVIEKS